MLELPEAAVIAGQLAKTIKDKIIRKIIAAQSPHKFAWYNGDPKGYDALLSGQAITHACSSGGYVEPFTDDAQLILGEGVNLRFYEEERTLTYAVH